MRWWIESYVDTRRMFDRVYSRLLEGLAESGINLPSGAYYIDIVNMPDSQNTNMEDKS